MIAFLAGIFIAGTLIPLSAENAEAAQSGWVRTSSGWHYYGKDGKTYKGWHHMSVKEGEKKSHWSYFDSNGVMYTGWHWMTSKEGEKTPHWSYFGPNGWLRTGWQRLGAADGEKTVHWSYFGANGWLRTGWQWLGAGDGEKTAHWSYFGPNGWLRTGWQKMGTSSNPDGNNKTHWSYFSNAGWLFTQTGAHYQGGKHFNNSGNGWAEIYNGIMSWDNDNASYLFKDGVVDKSRSSYTQEEFTYKLSNGRVKTDGNLYSANGRKTIIIGDSRTVLAYYYKAGGSYSRQINVRSGLECYIAKVGASYNNYNNWFASAISSAENSKVGKIDKNTDIVFCMGVNDIDISGNTNVTKYANTINSKADTWTKKGARVYYAAVGSWRGYDNLVNSWNNAIKAKLNKNVRWINSPVMTGYYANDGIHYNVEGSKRFIKEILLRR